MSQAIGPTGLQKRVAASVGSQNVTATIKAASDGKMVALDAGSRYCIFATLAGAAKITLTATIDDQALLPTEADLQSGNPVVSGFMLPETKVYTLDKGSSKFLGTIYGLSGIGVLSALPAGASVGDDDQAVVAALGGRAQIRFVYAGPAEQDGNYGLFNPTDTTVPD